MHEKISLTSYEQIIEPGKNCAHIEEIDVSHLGNCTEYLVSVGSFGWQYKYGGDSDLEFHEIVRKRGFKYLRGCQWPGQIWPYEVGRMLLEDLSGLDKKLNYACEEIYLSTFAYNYAKDKNIRVNLVEVIIDWQNGYEIKDPMYIINLRNKIGEGSAVCKLSDNIYDPVRQYLLE